MSAKLRLFIFAAIFLGGPEAVAANLNLEEHQLEARYRRGQASVHEAERLADLYFLTSRCPELLRLGGVLTPHVRRLRCLCKNEACKGISRDWTAFSRLRGLVEKGEDYRRPGVQAAARLSDRILDAGFWIHKALRAVPLSKRSPRMLELERALEEKLGNFEVRR